jgi:hypothetical protein
LSRLTTPAAFSTTFLCIKGQYLLAHTAQSYKRSDSANKGEP